MKVISKIVLDTFGIFLYHWSKQHFHLSTVFRKAALLTANIIPSLSLLTANTIPSLSSQVIHFASVRIHVPHIELVSYRHRMGTVQHLAQLSIFLVLDWILMTLSSLHRWDKNCSCFSSKHIAHSHCFLNNYNYQMVWFIGYIAVSDADIL